MSLQIPGIFPWWDRRNPNIPMPSNPWGWSTMIMIWRPPIPIPLPDTPPPPGTPFEDPSDKDPWPGRDPGKPGLGKPELMGASSGGAQGFETWYPGTPSWLAWWYGGQHHQKGPIDTGSGKGGPYGYAPMVNVSAGSTKSSVGEHMDAIDQAFKDQGFWMRYATPGLILIGVGLAGIATISALTACGNTWAMSIVGRSGFMRFKGLGRYFYNKGFNRLVTAAGKRYPKLAGNIHKHHIFPRYLQSSELWSSSGGGPITQIDAAYHQLITNAWRGKFAYGKNIQLAADKLASIGRLIHRILPLPYGVFPTW